ncbi:hypothetical protein [Streptomyces sp. WAC05374]|uniref:hypothetical protein n=1 Tax=Streptomyces sp. WAC05374 TaxID=2487420 RepID=UPI001F208CDF|nr:hypothetical protein [Streptomyces sp. WAC05374]
MATSSTPRKRTTRTTKQASSTKASAGKASGTKASSTKASATKASSTKASGTRAPSTKQPSRTSRASAPPAKESAGEPVRTTSAPGQHTVSFTVPSLDRVASGAANAALLPVAAARQVLPAKGGLPLYLGLGALGVADVIEWPVAIGIGVGYAVLRRGGVMSGARPRATATA